MTYSGLIPACAGKTENQGFSLECQWAHPRVCGENSGWTCAWLGPPGSSPRVRGKRRRVEIAGHGRGLIPACAGKTIGGLTGGESVGAHPRVCGENCFLWALKTFFLGSSPRVRGKLRQEYGRLPDTGLIPACAGKTGVSSKLRRERSAHPRVCGENVGHCVAGCIGVGSSPRVRGKQD